jgi:hypothetical protein
VSCCCNDFHNWYIYGFFYFNSDQWHRYIDSIFPMELGMKYTTKWSTSASYFEISLNWMLSANSQRNFVVNRMISIFSIINFPYLCCNIPPSPSPVYGLYISQLITYTGESLIYSQTVVWGSVRKDKLVSLGFVHSLETAFRKMLWSYNVLTFEITI